ncbi:hypothetical protein COP2_014490 [Malus domestica]
MSKRERRRSTARIVNGNRNEKLPLAVERPAVVAGLAQCLKMDSTMVVTSSSLMGQKALILLGEKSSRVQTFLTLT